MTRISYILVFLLCLTSLVSCQDSARKGRNLSFASEFNQPTDEETDETAEQTEAQRPDNAFRILTYCGCRGVNPIFAGTGCESVCQAKSGNNNDSVDMLYMTVTVDPVIQLNSYQNLQGWCTLPVEGNEEQNNGVCELQVESTQTGQQLASIDIDNVSNNEISFPISDLSNEQTYRVRVVERFSGAGSANTVQIRKKIFVESNLMTLGPVGVDPVNQYSCMVNLNFTINNDGTTSYISSTRSFFYYNQNVIYKPMPAGVKEAYCFDFIAEGVRNDEDRIEYPRLETVAGAFSLWDRDDPRFRDNWAWKPDEVGNSNNGNGISNNKDDILDLLEYEIYKLTLNENINLPQLFVELSGFIPPQVYVQGADTSEDENAAYGHYLTPLTKDGITTYCPDNSDYNATVDANPTDRALGIVLGVETEPLYTAVTATTEFFIDGNGQPQSLPNLELYITKSKLDEISFYINEDNVKVAPTEEDMDNKQIFFHWPPFSNYPNGSRFFRTVDQKVYRIKTPPASGNTGIVAKDGKIGCVPKAN